MQHVMVDLETLGTNADAVIMSFGAVKFDLDSDKIDDAGFYASISIDSNTALGRKISEDTLVWWMQQSPEAQAVFREPKQTLGSALESFAEWMSHGTSRFVWSNGASFDIPMIAHAYNDLGWNTPWQFYNERCVRTYKNLPGMKDIKIDNALKHNALQDAIAQAKQVQAIQKRLNATATAGHPMIKGAVA